MKQSDLPIPPKMLHVAIIMDGNGRWAARGGLPRAAGHRAGAAVVRRIAEAAPGLGVGTLTLYAFSADNWRRPPLEVGHLLDLLRGYLEREIGRCVQNGVRLTAIGRRDRLPAPLGAAIGAAEAATAQGRRLHLRLAIDYSSREAILATARRLDGARSDREEFARLLSADAAPDVDLVIRTGGEQRMSDFLLWESAYAELLFTDVAWPEFTAADLAVAIAEFHQRQRRFGGLPGEAQR
jgi:undecaprenyl diphosphate synthase